MNDFYLNPPSGPTFQRSIRWWPCFNTTGETIPPFACMMLFKPKQFKETATAKNTDEPNAFYLQHLRGGQVVWDVGKCNEAAEGRQDASEFVFNGPVPIQSLGYGQCTQDYPCQLLHDGSADLLQNMRACGPVKDKWYVRSGRGAFTCVCHDIGTAAGTGATHTIWARPNTGRSVAATGRWTIAADDLDADEYLDFGTGGHILGVELDADGWLKINRSGIYWFGFHGKLTSSDATRGTELAITLYRRAKTSDSGSKADPMATIYKATREMDIEQTMDTDYTEATLQRTAENVSMSGFDKLAAGEFLRLKNTTSHKKITLAGGAFSLVSVGGYDDDSARGQSLDTAS